MLVSNTLVGAQGRTAKKKPMLRPLLLGSPYVSAIMPGTMAIGALAKTPVRSLKTRKTGQFGDNAQAMVNKLNMKNVEIVSRFRPNCSLMGAHNIGPGDG